MTDNYRVTPRAAQDLKDIGRYTERTWGRKQRDAYLLALVQRFAWLAEHPDGGRHRPEVKEGYYSYPQGSHLVFYLRRGDGIDIIGIPHQHMDIVSHFLDTPARS